MRRIKVADPDRSSIRDRIEALDRADRKRRRMRGRTFSFAWLLVVLALVVIWLALVR